MTSKVAYVAPPPHFLHGWNAASLLPTPDIQHLTPELATSASAFMSSFIRFGKFRLWLKKMSTGLPDQFSKIN